MNDQTALLNLSSKDLRQAITLKERIERVQAQLTHLLGGAAAAPSAPRRGKRTMSAAARARIAAAQRARWAKVRGRKVHAAKVHAKRKRKVSAAARAKLAAIARARWAKVKKAGRSRL